MHTSSKFYILVAAQTSGMFESNRATFNAFKRLLESQYASQAAETMGDQLTLGESELAEENEQIQLTSGRQRRAHSGANHAQRLSGTSADEISGPHGSGHLVDTAALYPGYHHIKKQPPVQVHSEIIERAGTVKGSGEGRHHIQTEGQEPESRHYSLNPRVNGAFSDATIRRNQIRQEQEQSELVEAQTKTVKSSTEER